MFQNLIDLLKQPFDKEGCLAYFKERDYLKDKSISIDEKPGVWKAIGLDDEYRLILAQGDERTVLSSSENMTVCLLQ